MNADFDQQITPMQLRRRIGLTQLQLAFKLGVTVSTVSKWEQGKHSPLTKRSLLPKLLEVYQCSEGELYQAFQNIQQKKPPL